jgi:hypothetical protein
MGATRFAHRMIHIQGKLPGRSRVPPVSARLIFQAFTPDRSDYQAGYGSGRVRSAMVDGGRGCPDIDRREAMRARTLRVG